MSSQSTYNMIFIASIGVLSIWIFMLYIKAPPTITDVIKNTNFENRDECNALVNGLLLAMRPCGNTALKGVCDICRSGNVPDNMKPICSSPTIVGACAGV